jgi:hypothetical protein
LRHAVSSAWLECGRIAAAGVLRCLVDDSPLMGGGALTRKSLYGEGIECGDWDETSNAR